MTSAPLNYFSYTEAYLLLSLTATDFPEKTEGLDCPNSVEFPLPCPPLKIGGINRIDLHILMRR